MPCNWSTYGYQRIGMQRLMFHPDNCKCLITLIKAPCCYIVIVFWPFEHILAQSSKTVGNRENCLGITSQASLNGTFGDIATVVDDKACRCTCFNVSDRPTFSLHSLNLKTLWPILVIQTRSPPFGGAGKMPRHYNRPKATGAAFLAVCRTSINADQKWPNYSSLWPDGPVLRTFVTYLITFCSRPQAASEVITDVAVE